MELDLLLISKKKINYRNRVEDWLNQLLIDCCPADCSWPIVIVVSSSSKPNPKTRFPKILSEKFLPQNLGKKFLTENILPTKHFKVKGTQTGDDNDRLESKLVFKNLQDFSIYIWSIFEFENFES